MRLVLTISFPFYHRQPGEHKVHIKKHGKKVKGSPFTVTVEKDNFEGGSQKTAMVEEQITSQQQQQQQQTPTQQGPSAREICTQMHEQVTTIIGRIYTSHSLDFTIF